MIELILYLLLASLFIFTYSSQFQGCSSYPPANGNWIISSSDICYVNYPTAINGTLYIYGTLIIPNNSGLYFIGPQKIVISPGGKLQNFGKIDVANCINECNYGARMCSSKTIYECWSYGDNDPCSEWVVYSNVDCCSDADCPSDYYYCSGNSVYFRNYYCSNNQCAYSNSYVRNCDSYDGYYCNGNIREYRDYYCSGGSCTYTVTNSTNCNYYDGWYPISNGYEYRDYSCSGGSCTYTVTNSTDCNSYDGWYPISNGYEYRDYSCSGGSCTYTVNQTCYHVCTAGETTCENLQYCECRADVDTDPCYEWSCKSVICCTDLDCGCDCYPTGLCGEPTPCITYKCSSSHSCIFDECVHSCWIPV